MTHFSDQDRIKHPVEEYAQLQGGIFFLILRKARQGFLWLILEGTLEEILLFL